MSPYWNIKAAIIAVDGKSTYNILHDIWITAYLDNETEDYVSFQHWVQINYRSSYDRYLAYARLCGWL